MGNLMTNNDTDSPGIITATVISAKRLRDVARIATSDAVMVSTWLAERLSAMNMDALLAFRSVSGAFMSGQNTSGVDIVTLVSGRAFTWRIVVMNSIMLLGRLTRRVVALYETRSTYDPGMRSDTRIVGRVYCNQTCGT